MRRGDAAKGQVGVEVDEARLAAHEQLLGGEEIDAQRGGEAVRVLHAHRRAAQGVDADHVGKRGPRAEATAIVARARVERMGGGVLSMEGAAPQGAALGEDRP